jgi:putative SOS response-associated peptidase YedK
MCGRYTLATPAGLISEHFDLDETPEVTDRYNIAPSQEALIIAARKDGSRAAGKGRWGLAAPHLRWTKGRPPINARIETVGEKPTFRDGFERRRCLVPADGFYEWRADADGKTPCYFSLQSGDPFAFAGIWNQPTTDDDPVTFAILTTIPNPVVEPVHARMPVILRRELFDLWLARRALSTEETQGFAEPFPAERMQCWPVSQQVNSPANDTAACIAPLDFY